jgi:tRNA(Ile)-lysidine synthase
LASIADRVGASVVLVAHTRDDQAETVLLNLVRGSGLGGLAGMPLDETVSLRKMGPPLSDLPNAEHVRVVRPLLGIDRPTTLAYCAEQGLSIVEDASNQSRAYTRNRVRLDLLPALERFNPAIREVLARTADLLSEDASALDAVVESLHAGIVERVDADTLRYPLQRWRAQPRGLQRRLLRRGLEVLLGTLRDVRAQPIDDALALLRSESPGQTYHLPHGVEVCVGHDVFELRRHGHARARSARKIWDREVPRV